MKLVKTFIVGTVMTAALFGLQAFARGGGGGFAGGMGGRPSFGASSPTTAFGRGSGMSQTNGFGSAFGGLRNDGDANRMGRVSNARNFGRDRFGRIGFGVGYPFGFGDLSDDSAVPQTPVDNSVVDYERERDRKRLSLPDSAFVKNYGVVRLSSNAKHAHSL